MARSIYPRTIVEKTPNHRPGMPSYTAWTLNDFKADGLTPPSADNRPRFSIQIYDTTPAAASDAHIKWLCQYIHECTPTLKGRDYVGRYEIDRVELYGLPAEKEDEDEETRAQRCVEHQKTEIASRNATGLPDYYINWSLAGPFYRDILVIDRPLAGLEAVGQDDHPPNPGPHGGFYTASWDLRPAYAKWWQEAKRDDPDEESELRDELTVTRGNMTLPAELRSFRDGFSQCYFLDGCMDEELRQARALADGNQYAHDPGFWSH